MTAIRDRYMYLRPIVPDDFANLYEWSATSGIGDRWRFHGEMPSYDRFVETLFFGVLEHKVVVTRADNKAVGVLTAYNADHRSGTCYLSAVSSPAFLSKGLVPLGAAVFADSIFDSWPMRHIYLEIFSYNLPVLNSVLVRIAKEEACLKDDLFWDDAYYDRLIFSIERERWCEEVRPLLIADAATLRTLT
jgi:RimJ/RimL family protein N-acetyltransferase